MRENFRRHLILRSGGIASKKPILVAIMRDDRQREFFKFLEALAEIFLAVISARLRHLSADRAMLAVAQLAYLTGPAAVGAFNALADALEKHIEGHLERERAVDRKAALRKPLIQKNRLRQAARETIEHPSARLLGKPIGEDAAHQVIGQVVTAGKNWRRGFSKLGLVFDLLAQHCAGAEVAKTKAFGEAFALGSLAGCRRAKQHDAQRSGRGIDQWSLL